MTDRPGDEAGDRAEDEPGQGDPGVDPALEHDERGLLRSTDPGDLFSRCRNYWSFGPLGGAQSAAKLGDDGPAERHVIRLEECIDPAGQRLASAKSHCRP